MLKKTFANKKVFRRVNKKKLESFVAAVIDFYSKYGRHDLLWRKNITPYKVLLSEVMLQQTQVSRVTPKYRLWILKYPTLKKLHVASLSEVLVLWQGLGYQRRAKALLEIAKKEKSIPKTFQELRSLPGVGEYTASAIMAFAYDVFDNPVIETNIRTALIENFYKKKSSIDDLHLHLLLRELMLIQPVKDLGARNWYYALMDYGAHLKSKSISHNIKSSTYKKQTKYRGSQRELRAKTLFAIIHKKELPDDERLTTVLAELLKEKFIKKTNSSYQVV
ncbi:MAG: A/G-specific adenine glycosylase [Candidatus Pacebacteria bacterium]|nr:A/G-specific adenine glycosylase [Candidatus Paceibacterota bacterium]